jgi:hypothetical protein
MATFHKHRDASDRFHEDMGKASDTAIQAIGEVLRSVGRSLGRDQGAESPEAIVADAAVGVGQTHADFHERALDAMARAVKKLRERG